MTPLYQSFITSVRMADTNVLIMFAASACVVITWKAIAMLPAWLQKYVRPAAWMWAILFTVATIIYPA